MHAYSQQLGARRSPVRAPSRALEGTGGHVSILGGAGWSPADFGPGSADGGRDNATTIAGPRLALYSAHDTTIAAVLSALGVYARCCAECACGAGR